MKLLCALLFSVSILLSSPSAANNSPIEAAQTCLTDSTSGKDRKLLAKWIFVAMAAHPELASLSAVPEPVKDDTSREFAELVMRLITVDCKVQMQAMLATDADISKTLGVAFSHLGQVAMLELMTNKDVDASVSGFGKFLDEEKLSAVLKKKTDG